MGQITAGTQDENMGNIFSFNCVLKERLVIQRVERNPDSNQSKSSVQHHEFLNWK